MQGKHTQTHDYTMTHSIILLTKGQLDKRKIKSNLVSAMGFRNDLHVSVFRVAHSHQIHLYFTHIY